MGRSCRCGHVGVARPSGPPPSLSFEEAGHTHRGNGASARVVFDDGVNICLGKMGKAVIKAADSAELDLIPMSFGCVEEAGKTVEVFFREHPNMIVVDYTAPDVVNSNAELYCNVGVPFVMGTTGGDRDRLYKTVKDSNVYAIISLEMGKHVVAFLAAMEIMAEQFPGAFSGYSLKEFIQVESHQSSKLDTSGTAKAVICCFEKLGVSFDMDQVGCEIIVSFEFQHNVCGRSIYGEGTVGAVLILAKKIQQKADQHTHNMIDVLREVSMR
ncbi:hypothetical protein ACJRO7_000292 [Eucalyptus globulus]|uniref:Dihydrodipicolinate reductase N-terminal domain-containing protein n=1 Tax=Eucalyptus globulus TaxID=34317 RepID=A0ABD3LM79_EUCGL